MFGDCKGLCVDAYVSSYVPVMIRSGVRLSFHAPQRALLKTWQQCEPERFGNREISSFTWY